MRYLALLICASLLAACGQKGPLYLPAKPPAASVPAPEADTGTEAASSPETSQQP